MRFLWILYGCQMTKVMILYSEKLWKVQEDCRKKEEEKKQTNKQTRRTNKPGGTGIRQNQTNGVRNTQSKHQILSLQQIIFVHQVVKGLLRSKVNKI